MQLWIICIIAGLAALSLGTQGFSANGIPLAPDCRLTGTGGRITGLLCLLGGLGLCVFGFLGIKTNSFEDDLSAQNRTILQENMDRTQREIEELRPELLENLRNINKEPLPGLGQVPEDIDHDGRGILQRGIDGQNVAGEIDMEWTGTQ